jgi:hypothetical protein
MKKVETTADVAEAGAHVAPVKESPKKVARASKAPKGRKTPKKTTRRAKKAPQAERRPRAESKGAQILGLIGRAKGATLAEIMTATGWQAHSVRGFISTAGKKHGVTIESTKSDAGDRLYRATK